MSLEQIQQNYADSTGFVMDRTCNPPKILGQAFLVSKSRAVTCASVVYNYLEAPWALEVVFPHPDIVLGLKSIALHNEFDKKAARAWYLNQTGTPGEQLLLPNDMASLVLDGTLPEMAPDKIGELNRALTIPFNSENVAASGNIAGPELLSVLTGIIQSRRTGLLTLFDARNIPIGRIQLNQGHIEKVFFGGILGELAFFELIYRNPCNGYVFQTETDFQWGNVRDIVAPSDALCAEANRRVAELPQMLAYLGGSEVRYQKRIESVDPSSVNEQVQWLVERLWENLDGYMVLDKLSERVGADTYTVAQTLRELSNGAAISMINRATPFHCNGQLGTPLTSHTDFEVHAWDPLQAFYLDPLSGKGVWAQGNFFGVANALQPKNMLHTIALPPNIPGSLILKDYKLIGVHSGAHVPKPGQPAPPVKLYQMVWMGALLDLSTKKLRSSLEEGADQQSTMTRLRTDEPEALDPNAEKPQKFVCPSCHTTNTRIGPCFNCGTIIEAPIVDPASESKLAQSAVGRQILEVQKKTGLSTKMLAIGGGIIVAIPLLFMTMCGQTQAPPAPSINQTAADLHKVPDGTIQNAVQYAGFTGTAIPGYWFTDTTALTAPAKSFGMESEQSNNKVLFVIMDDMAPMKNLQAFSGKVPYQPDLVNDELLTPDQAMTSSLLGSEKLDIWNGFYKDDKKQRIKVLIGAFPSPILGKSVLLVSRALDSSKPFDPRATQFLVDQMEVALKDRADNSDTKASVKSGEEAKPEKEEKKEERKVASDEDIDSFCETIATSIFDKMKLPDEVQKDVEEKHFKKLKCTLTVGIDPDGNVKKLELTKSAENDAVTNALQKAVNACAPFEDAPQTKDPLLTVVVKFTGDKVKVERQ
ncbi:MAG: hypothetical protein P4L53_02570 [Candidatus Obscuribacterales bacterium]|nr:hypothetical protein [Candidatus Obscuribacterales bacterium]